MTPLAMIRQLTGDNGLARRSLTGEGAPGLATLLGGGEMVAGDDSGGRGGGVGGSSRSVSVRPDIYVQANGQSSVIRGGGGTGAGNVRPGVIDDGGRRE
jgi:hypothetical protein